MDGIPDSQQNSWNDHALDDLLSNYLSDIDVLSNDTADGGYYGGICLNDNDGAGGHCGTRDTIVIRSGPIHGSSDMYANAGTPLHGQLHFNFSDSSSYCGSYEYMTYVWQDQCQGVSRTALVRVPIPCPMINNKAISLSGSEWIRVPAGAGSGLDLSGPFTIECWVKPSAFGNAGTVVSRWGDAQVNDRSYMVAVTVDGAIQFEVSRNDTQGNTTFEYFISGALITNVWQHIACTYDPNIGLRRTYINGDLVGEKATTGPIHTGSTDLSIGAKLGNNLAQPGQVSRFFRGSIDNVRIWPAALDRGQIQFFMGVRFLPSASAPQHGPSPVCAWELDGDAHDSFGLSSGTEVGAVSYVDALDILTPNQDCDGNGIPDYYEIAVDGLLDQNHNGILDACEAFTSFCHPSQDGVMACPCGNRGLSGSGCDNSSSTGGARLSETGVASLSNDTVTFHTTGEKPTALSVVGQGQSLIQSGVTFGQGVRCAGSPLKRLYVKTAVQGSIEAPQPGDPSVSVRSAALGDTITPGSIRYYYVYYRDQTVLGGCPPTHTFNSTQNGALTWQP